MTAIININRIHTRARPLAIAISDARTREKALFILKDVTVTPKKVVDLIELMKILRFYGANTEARK